MADQVSPEPESAPIPTPAEAPKSEPKPEYKPEPKVEYKSEPKSEPKVDRAVQVESPKAQPTKAPALPDEVASDIEKLKAQVNNLALANLINDYKVPSKLQGLIPNDLGKAKEFIESDHYKSLLDDLSKLSELEKQKAELQSKLDALNHPQQVAATPVPDAKTEPAKDVPAKRWEDITPESLALIGSVILKDL